MQTFDDSSPVHYIIRSLQEGDVPAFIELRAKGLELSPEAFGESLEEFKAQSLEAVTQRLLSAESHGGFTLGGFRHDGPLVGVVGMRVQHGIKSRHRGVVWGMFVSPEERGKGLGRALLAECIERSRRVQGLEQLILSVVVDNGTASTLYRLVGFEVYGRDPAALKVDGRPLDEYLMWLPLSLRS
jgi:ribosomal protein S18 acetylase RimI-like enzyme